MRILLVLVVIAGCSSRARAPQPRAVEGWCTPDESCWPSAEEWERFGETLAGDLEVPRSPLAPCLDDATSAACTAVIEGLSNPFAVQDDAAGTLTSGWLDA